MPRNSWTVQETKNHRNERKLFSIIVKTFIPLLSLDVVLDIPHLHVNVRIHGFALEYLDESLSFHAIDALVFTLLLCGFSLIRDRDFNCTFDNSKSYEFVFLSTNADTFLMIFNDQ